MTVAESKWPGCESDADVRVFTYKPEELPTVCDGIVGTYRLYAYSIRSPYSCPGVQVLKWL